jgi:hypothetical protein
LPLVFHRQGPILFTEINEIALIQLHITAWQLPIDTIAEILSGYSKTSIHSVFVFPAKLPRIISPQKIADYYYSISFPTMSF